MMSNYSKFGVDTFNTFWVMGYIKVFVYADDHNNDSNNNNPAIAIAWLFLWNSQA